MATTPYHQLTEGYSQLAGGYAQLAGGANPSAQQSFADMKARAIDAQLRGLGYGGSTAASARAQMVLQGQLGAHTPSGTITTGFASAGVDNEPARRSIRQILQAETDNWLREIK